MEIKKVLISGGSIAGLTSAYWLNENGFEVTIVEKASEIRGGGYPIDVRGSAINIAKMMGIYEQLKIKSLDNMKFRFLDRNNNVVGKFTDAAMKENDDIEIPRGYLTTALYETIQEKNIQIIYNDSIKTINHQNDSIKIELESGKKEVFDIVVGADGIHSNTRKLTFGEEKNYSKYLGYCFTGFTMENYLNLYKEGLIYSEAGNTSVIYATEDKDSVHAFLVFYDTNEPEINHRDTERHKKLLKDRFSNLGGITPRMLESLDETEGLYFDTTTQIIMDSWSKENVVLVGDAAYAPSFLTGQGSSLAMIGAYILANELKSSEDTNEAFESYEKVMKPFVELNQRTVGKDSFSIVALKNDKELEKRNAILEQMSNKTDEEIGSNDVIDITRVIEYSDL